MNVLLVIEGTYPWYRGGVSEWIYQYLKNSPDITFSILQISTNPFLISDFSDSLYPILDNVESFDRLATPIFKDNWNSSLNNWYSHNSSIIEDSFKNQDVVHVTNTGFAGWLGSKISKEFEVPLILTEHAIYWLEVEKGAVALECGYQIQDNIQSKNEIVSLFQDIAKSVYENSERVITVSECNIPLQQKLGAKKIDYIPNGIPSEWLNNSAKIRGNPVIGWVGRCAEMKNPLEFFEFIDQFNSLQFSVNFLMIISDAGEYELEKKVVEKSKEYKNLEIIWNEASKSFFPKMDMLLITSHNESQPLVMFEALSQKVLPIGREVGDLTNKYGFTFSTDSSIADICNEVINLWKNQDEFNSYVDARFDLIIEHHTWETIFESYQYLLKETVLEIGII